MALGGVCCLPGPGLPPQNQLGTKHSTSAEKGRGSTFLFEINYRKQTLDEKATNKGGMTGKFAYMFRSFLVQGEF